MGFTSRQINFIETAREMFASDDHGNLNVDRYQLQEIADKVGSGFQWITTNPEDYRVARGLYMIPPTPDYSEPTAKTVAPSKQSVKDTKIEESTSMSMSRGSASENVYKPEVDNLYVPYGHFSDVGSIIKSKQFYPMFITGLSGNGKTMMVEQACAKAKRDLYRVNITVETDEDDLLGGFRLVDGETVWFDGPVVQAMRTGSILLLDEVDLASTKIMCLQPVLEGKGVFLKKINEWVDAQEGFNIVATANTKGKGDDTGNFIGAGVMNEAFLERFPITMEQDYPSESVEKKILSKMFDSLNIKDVSDYVDNLVRWADIIRKTYLEGAIDEIITTRRLVHIAKAFGIFSKDKNPSLKAIMMCVNRFDSDTKEAMIDLYTKIDSGIEDDTQNIKNDYIQDETHDQPF